MIFPGIFGGISWNTYEIPIAMALHGAVLEAPAIPGGAKIHE
jgi:hypothetical protein